MVDEIIKIAQEAGDKVREIYYKDFKVEYKSDDSPVTEADYFSDKIIIAGLKKFDIPVLSEESKDDFSRLNSDRVWIVDSLDGTSDFVQKTHEFSIMIGLAEEGVPVLGVVHLPYFNRTYFAEKGNGAYLLDKRGEKHKISVSKKENIDDAVVVRSRNHFSDEDRKLLDNLGVTNATKCGSNGIKMCLVAEGKADFFFNTSSRMGQWDMCAPNIIVEEAGGRATNSKGKDLVYNRKGVKMEGGVVVSNGIIHDKIISITKEI